MASGVPLFMQPVTGDPNISYSANDMRHLVTAALGPHGGDQCMWPAAFQPQPRAAGANMTVELLAGSAVVRGDDASYQGGYLCTMPATDSVVVPPAPSSGTRTHRIVLRVRDKMHNGTWGSYEWVTELLADTGTGTPALPASAMNICTVAVAAGQTSVTASHIVDLRPVNVPYATVTSVTIESGWGAGSEGIRLVRTPLPGVVGGALVFLTGNFVRTGAQITAGTSGNISDVPMFNIPAPYRPKNFHFLPVQIIAESMGSARIGTDGGCVLQELSPSTVVPTGAGVRVASTWIQVP